MAPKVYLGSGLALAAILFIFVNSVGFLGETCYYFGELSFNTFCVKPAIYKGAWFVAAALIGFGAWKLYEGQSRRP